MPDRGRQAIVLMAAIYLGEMRCRVRIKDISPDGGKVAVSVPSAVPGSVLSIELPNVGSVRGRVARADNGQFGIAFDTPIDRAAVRQPVPGNFAAVRPASDLRRLAG